MRASFVKGRAFQDQPFHRPQPTTRVDGELARANAIAVRTPYQSQSDARKLCNKGGINYFDTHLSPYGSRDPPLRILRRP